MYKEAFGLTFPYPTQLCGVGSLLNIKYIALVQPQQFYKSQLLLPSGPQIQFQRSPLIPLSSQFPASYQRINAEQIVDPGRKAIFFPASSYFSRVQLCDPIDSSPPGSTVLGILQARILDWVAISFSNAWKWKIQVKSLSHVQLSATPWTAAYQTPLSMGFSRQEYWSGVPLPSPSCLIHSWKHATEPNI